MRRTITQKHGIYCGNLGLWAILLPVPKSRVSYGGGGGNDERGDTPPRGMRWYASSLCSEVTSGGFWGPKMVEK